MLLALLLAASPALAAEPPLPVPLPASTEVKLSADRLVREADGLVRAEGAVRLSAGELELAAPLIFYDPALGTVEASGGVVVVDRKFAALATTVQLNLGTGAGLLTGAALFEKRAPPGAAALALRDVAGLAALGENALDVRADRIVRNPEGTFVAFDPSVTTCDCDGDPPSWRIAATRATVTPGESVALSWPVLYAREVPVATFPYVSLPLERRKTGLLLPDVGYSARRGPSVSESVFVVLGDSYDLTFSSGYFAGVASGTAFRGPKEGLELRWAPRKGSEGTAFVSWAYDLSARGGLPHRTTYQLSESDSFSHGLSDRVALSLVSDRTYVSDFTDDVRYRTDQALRSYAWGARRGEQTLLVVEGTYLQDLRSWGQPLPGQFPVDLSSDQRMFGPDARPTFQRLPALDADVVRFPITGGLASLHLGAARFAPLQGGAFGDEGLDGLGPGDVGYFGPDSGEGNGRIDPGERLAVTRLSLRPGISVPLAAPPYVTATGFAGYREQLYLYDGTADGSAGFGVIGASARSDVARTFGAGAGAVRHTVGPRLELRRLVPGPAEAEPGRPYDDLDLRPGAPTTQALVALSQRADLAPARGQPPIFAQLRLGEELTVAPAGGPAELFADAALGFGRVTAAGLVRIDPSSSATTELAADAAVGNARGDQLRGGYRRLSTGGSARVRAGPDELLAQAPAPAWLPGIDQVTGGVTAVVVEGLTLRYDILWLFTLGQPLQQTAGLGYVSGCRCWTAGLTAALRRGQEIPDLFLTADLAGVVHGQP